MSTAMIQKQAAAMQPAESEALQIRVALNSNLWGMKDESVWQYYRQMCDYLGIDAVSHPFDVITDAKQQVKKLYPNSICTAQLGEKRGYSYGELQIKVDEELTKLGLGLARVAITCHAPNGRSLTAEAFVDVKSGGYQGAPLTGNALVNAFKKAATQCRRRATLQMAGLALPSEEIPTVKTDDLDTGTEGIVIEHPPAGMLTVAAAPTGSPDEFTEEERAIYESAVAEEYGQTEATQEEFWEVVQNRQIPSKDAAGLAKEAATGAITWSEAIAKLPNK